MQVVFAVLYLATQALVMVLYARSAAVPPYIHILLAASKRMHSIYVLRLFNDCWTMLFAYVAVLLLTQHRFAPAISIFSLAVSTKMNVLLFAPGVLAACLLVRPPCPCPRMPGLTTRPSMEHCSQAQASGAQNRFRVTGNAQLAVCASTGVRGRSMHLISLLLPLWLIVGAQWVMQFTWITAGMNGRHSQGCMHERSVRQYGSQRQ